MRRRLRLNKITREEREAARAMRDYARNDR